MADLITASAALAGIAKTVSEIAASGDSAKRNSLLIEFQQATIQANALIASEQTRNASLMARNQELEAEIVQLKNWEAEKKQYVLTEFSYGMYAQVHQSNVQPISTAHKYCNACFENNRKSLLQLQLTPNRSKYLVCNQCKSSLNLFHNRFSSEEAA